LHFTDTKQGKSVTWLDVRSHHCHVWLKTRLLAAELTNAENSCKTALCLEVNNMTAYLPPAVWQSLVGFRLHVQRLATKQNAISTEGGWNLRSYFNPFVDESLRNFQTM